MSGMPRRFLAVEQAVVTAGQQLDVIVSEIAHLRAEADNFRARATQAAKDRDQARAELVEARTTIGKLSAERDTSRRRAVEADGELQRWKANGEFGANQRHTMQVQLEKLQRELGAARAELAELRGPAGAEHGQASDLELQDAAASEIDAREQETEEGRV